MRTHAGVQGYPRGELNCLRARATVYGARAESEVVKGKACYGERERGEGERRALE